MGLAKRATKGRGGGRGANGRGGGRGASGRGGGRARGGGRGRGRAPWSLKASLCATGGRCGRKCYPLETTRGVDTLGHNRQFVKVDRFSTWLCKSVTGKTGLAKWSRLCPILTTVSAAYLAAVDPDSYKAPEVDVTPADVVHDPMDKMQLEGVESTAPPSEELAKKRTRTKAVFSNQVVEVRVPQESELLARRTQDARVIRILAKAADNRVFWLDEEDIDWLIRVMIVEFDLRGVPQLREQEYGSAPARPAPTASASSVEDAGQGGNAPVAGASSVEGVGESHPAEQIDIVWSFANDCWEATFQAPPKLKGKKMACRVADLSPEKAILVGVEDLESLEHTKKMDVAKDYLQFKAAQVVQAAIQATAAAQVVHAAQVVQAAMQATAEATLASTS